MEWLLESVSQNTGGQAGKPGIKETWADNQQKPGIKELGQIYEGSLDQETSVCSPFEGTRFPDTASLVKQIVKQTPPMHIFNFILLLSCVDMIRCHTNNSFPSKFILCQNSEALTKRSLEKLAIWKNTKFKDYTC